MGTLACLAAFLLVAGVPAVADWADCPAPCQCKWIGGKKTALCDRKGLQTLPRDLDEGMQVLNIAGNPLKRLQRQVFKSLGLINLQKIYLSMCGLREVHPETFKDLRILIEVDLSENHIAKLHPETFRGSERLRMINLNGNPLSALAQAQFPALPYLKDLEMERCQLEYIHREAFIHLTALETINLKNNFLRNLSEATFMNFAHLKTLLLEGNPWKCDCELRDFRDWFLASKLQSVRLPCSDPEVLIDKSWEEVPSEDFACAPSVSAYPQHQVQAEAGGNVSFGCRVWGDPEPQVSWLYEGRPINHTWLVLEAEEGLLDKWANISVFNVSDADAGVYTCVARNALAAAATNVSLVLPEVVTATTLSKSESVVAWWGAAAAGVAVGVVAVAAVAAACCARGRRGGGGRSRDLKASVSFTDQEKKLLDVSVATTTERSSCEALAADDGADRPVHITIEREPLPLVVFPPPPEFGGNPGAALPPPGAYGNIFISVSVSRGEPPAAARAAPDLLDLPRRPPVYHGVATLPRRPLHARPPVPVYDNMGPRVTAGGECSSTLSLPDAAAAATPVRQFEAELPPPPPPPCAATPHLPTPEFVSL